jgi:hypothetical protein
MTPTPLIAGSVDASQMLNALRFMNFRRANPPIKPLISGSVDECQANANDPSSALAIPWAIPSIPVKLVEKVVLVPQPLSFAIQSTELCQ